MRFEVRHPAIARHQSDRARNISGVDAPLNHLVNSLETFRRKTHFLWLRPWQCRSRDWQHKKSDEKNVLPRPGR